MRVQKIHETILNGFQLYQSLQILNDPYDLERILSLSHSLLRTAKPEDVKQTFESIRWTTDGIAAVEDRYRISIPAVEILLTYPKKTLGHAFGTFLRAYDINPADVRPPKITDDLTYLAAHLSETHDLWHLVTGFAPELDGEAGLAAFVAAQTNSPFQIGIVAGSLLYGMKEDPWKIATRMDAISRGWQMGKNAESLVGFRWDRHWEEELTEVREMLNIVI